ncbi:MAG: hypothetical protein M3Q07_01880 [Pseudobdellovibrionaceae bacterium]|nr:hypothetical protein [Pseudobdellovibrionaceae bacterium]
MALTENQIKSSKSAKSNSTPDLDFSSPIIPVKKPEDIVDFEKADRILKGLQEDLKLQISDPTTKQDSISSEMPERKQLKEPKVTTVNSKQRKGAIKLSKTASRLMSVTFKEFKDIHSLREGDSFSGSIPYFAKSLNMSTRSMQHYFSNWRSLKWIEVICDYDPKTKSNQIYRVTKA